MSNETAAANGNVRRGGLFGKQVLRAEKGHERRSP